MPIPFFDANAQTALGNHILRELEGVRTLEPTQERARAYECLGKDYRELHMYGRSIEMYRQSLAVSPSEDVQIRLAEVLINLLGEPGFDEARSLVSSHPPLDRWVIIRSMDEHSSVPATQPQRRSFPPPSASEIAQLIQRKRMAIKRQASRATLDNAHPALKDLVGESEHVLQVCNQIRTYAPGNLSVLITGDTGTGKEVVARAIYKHSFRRDHPLITVNCAALPDTLLESELFGHEKGAFTGAVTQKRGTFEQADGGTLFLDEVGDLSPAAQAKVLRAIQEGTFERLGGKQSLTVDVRFISATNQPLEKMMEEGRFRKDLYDRLRGVKIALSPLDDRFEDLPLLTRHFIQKHRLESADKPISDFDIFRWLCDCYLPAHPSRYKDSIDKMLAATRLTWVGKDTPPKRRDEPLGGSLNIRDLEQSVQRAAQDGTFVCYGDRPYEDVLRFEGRTALGARCYTTQQIEQYDWRIALEVCRFQKDAGRLMGIDDPRKVSKILTRLRLSKKQRKARQAQAQG